MTQIEQSTIYAYKLKYLENPNFDKIRSFAKNFIDELPQDLQSELYEKINRGIDQLETEPEMLVYLYSFGNMHQAKLNYAFEHLPDSFFEQSEINIIDYGCGQAIGTMCYVDFLKRKNPNQKIKSVTLIEPSEISLKRAGLHTSVFLPDAEIRLINKTFDQLSDDDLETIQNFCESMDTNAQVFDQNDTKWSKPHNVKVFSEETLNSFIKEVWIDTLSSTSTDGKVYSRRYVFINYDGTVKKILADKAMDKFPDKTCFDPSKVYIFDRTALDDGLTITMCAGKPNGKIHQIENDENIPTLHILSNVLDLDFDLPRFSSLINRNIKGYNQFVCVGPYFNYSKKDQRMQEFAESLNGDVSFFKILDKGELFPLKSWTCQAVLFSLTEEEKNLSTIVTGDDIKNGIEDEYGVVYSKDGKRLLIAPFEFSGEYSVKKGTKVICDRAFFCNFHNISESLQSITIPSSVTSIGDDAFMGCISLKSITIPPSVTSIGNGAFIDCKSLQSITIPSSVTSIGNYAFEGCYYLESVTIPDNVTSIGDVAFMRCISLKSITIPSSVTSIGNWAFRGCKSLLSITISSSVTSIGYETFGGCISIQSIYIPLGSRKKFEKMLPEYKDKLKEV